MSQHHTKELRFYLDEAGRGPLAGPVFVGCVMPLEKFDTSMFYDSKQLSEKQRNECYAHILELEVGWSVVFASWRAENTEIDEFGIITALRLASLRALLLCLQKFYHLHQKSSLLASTHGEDLLAQQKIEQLLYAKANAHTHHHPNIWEPITDNRHHLSQIVSLENSLYSFKALLLDGNHSFWLEHILPIPLTTIIKGDSKNAFISMASIVAKVERDKRMTEIAPAFPGYDFWKNKGYGSKEHRDTIKSQGATPLHRKSFLKTIMMEVLEHAKWKTQDVTLAYPTTNFPLDKHLESWILNLESWKPKLLLHICCAPDLTRPLHWLKNHFKLYLFRYNPNIHPRKEHDQRYAQFLKLVGLEEGDYEILEDWYDPKEFFDAMYEKKDLIHPDLKDADYKTVQQTSWSMEEWSDRCNPCYLMRLEQAAKQAALQGIPYFTSTLLISPKKKMDKLFKRGLEAENKHPWTKFLRFDFIKNKGYDKASELTKKHGLRRQNYCGCGRTIPKPGERKTSYSWW
jgi:predicted adenine nucleotide alpha hydrolase (AANH) superfamily ATPase/ribonuclease HII